MPVLDNYTLYLSHLASSIICTVMMLILWRHNRHSWKGLGWWLMAFAAHVAALGTVLLYGVVPDWFLTPTSNTLFMGSFVALQVGAKRFLGKTVSPMRQGLLLMLFWAINFAFTLVWPSPGVRISSIALGTLLICTQGLSLWRTAEAETRRVMRILLWVGAGFALVSVIRIAFVALLASENGAFQLATAEAIALLLYQIGFIALTFGLSFTVNLRVTLARDAQEMALRASEEQFRTLFETIPQGVLYLDAEGYVRQANPAARSILGLDQEQMVGRASVDPHWRTVHEDGSDFPPAEHPALVALRTGEPVLDCTMGIFNPHIETWRWVVINAVPQFRPGDMHPYQVYVTLTDITARRAKEAALRASEERYRTLVELSPDGIGILDRRGRFLTGNERFVRMHGYARVAELVGHSIRDFITPQELSKLLKSIMPVLQSGAVAHGVEAEARLRDGNSMIAEYSVAAIPWSEASGGTAHIVSVRDVTERRQLLDALHAAREHLEARVQERTSALEAEVGERKAAEAIAVKRARELATLHALSRAVSASLAPQTVMDAALDESITLPSADIALLFLRRDRQALELAGQRVKQLSWQMDTAEVARLAAGLSAAGVLEGTLLYCGDTVNALQCPFTTNPALHSLIALPLQSSATVMGALVLGARTAAAFVEQRAFLETVADHVAVGLQNALWYQEIGERSAGLEELVAERTFELRTERDRTQAILDTLGEAVTVTDMEGQVLFANPAKFRLTGRSGEALLGQPLWQRWSGPPPAEIWPTIRRILGAEGLWHGEISEQRQDGAVVITATTGALLRSPDTAAADSSIVWVQRDITPLKEAERLKNAFVSNVSHELRTPLAVITLTADNLLTFYERLDESRRQRMIEAIHTQTQQLTRLIEDVLQVSRLDDGRVSLARDWVDLAQLVQQETENCRPLASQKAQQLTVECEVTAQVWANERQLGRALGNLLSNAIKFTPAEGHITCSCSIETTAADSWAVIQVADTGPGIAIEDLPHLFERFYRSQSVTGIPGTGLGLPIAQDLAHMHGGEIGVLSTPGVGSTFTLRLPLTQEACA